MQDKRPDIAQTLQQALAHHQQGRLTEAERLYELALQHEPANFDALHLCGVVALQTGRPARAAELIGRAVEINPNAPPVFNNLGVALQGVGRMAEAATAFTRAAALKPDYVEAIANRGNALHALGQYGGAVESFDRAIALKPDAAVLHFNRGNALNALGRHQEAARSFERAIALKPDLAEAYNNLGRVLIDLARYDEALAKLDRAVALKPAYAEAHNNRGHALWRLARLTEALAAGERATTLQPDLTGAHVNRANVLNDLDRPAEALVCLDRAVVLSPNSAEIHGRRGAILLELDRAEQALASYDRAIGLEPDNAQAHYDRGVVLKALGRLEEAVASYDRAIALRSDYAEPYWNKSHILLATGQFAQGWPLYEWRKKKAVPVANWSYPQPHWSGSEPLTGKTLYLRWEQGFGDVIQFSRYAPMVATLGARVVMSVPDPLVRLLKPLGPTIEIIGGDRKPIAFDYYCALMSLPTAFATTLETIPPVPPLVADPALKAQWSVRLPSGGKPRIGVVWSGRAMHNNHRNRSIGLDIVKPLFDFDAHWISLQKEFLPGDAEALAALPGTTVLGGDLGDFADTAAVIDQLDLVISIDTGVAHLAGTLGKPTWILLPFDADWRWLHGRSDSPWYPSVRLFRQEKPGDWPSVVASVETALTERFATDRPDV